MDPITTAIVAALASDLTKTAIKHSYNALKSAFKEKFGSDSDLVEAVNGLEKKPDSEGRKVTLQEEVENAKVNDDPDILQLAQELLKQVKSEEPVAGIKFKTEFQAEVKAAQIGDYNKQQNKFG
ncbi:MAG: hypothetical protein F6K36_25755 [Symploca sp. SIO3C6]|nr:hypothetical protein [Symploca sp. SIO3C6]